MQAHQTPAQKKALNINRPFVHNRLYFPVCVHVFVTSPKIRDIITFLCLYNCHAGPCVNGNSQRSLTAAAAVAGCQKA